MVKTIKVLTGRVRVTRTKGSKRIRGVFHKGRFHAPRSTFKKGIKIASRVRIGKSKRIFVSPRRR